MRATASRLRRRRPPAPRCRTAAPRRAAPVPAGPASSTPSFGANAITTVWDWLNQLNAANFPGHNDWRLPSELGCNGPGVWGPPGYTCGSSDPHELETILLEPYGCGTSPCIDPIFGPTASNRYWSSSLSVP